MEEALKKAVTKAIEEVGLENFKKTSMFLSNEKKPNPLLGLITYYYNGQVIKVP